MAFYTAATVLPRTPDAFKMNATIRFNSWAPWRSSSKTPLTPPLSSTFQSKVPLQQQPHVERMILPPIAHLERHLPPLTPPEDILPTSRGPLPKLSTEDFFQSKQPVEMAYLVDWLDSTRRSAHSVAEKTCEMICYLWFATSPPERSQPSSSGSPPLFTRGSSPSTLQLVATPNFVQFMQKLLETTQVSQSVMVLSLHYIHRLKERNRFTPAQSGSEFRIAVAGLMMANKFLDDNTYTNKTWSEVSGIDLDEINRMEREFLVGVDFNLYVDKSTYESWLNLLKGLIMAKERDSKHFRKSRNLARQSRLAATPHYPSSTGPATRTYVSSSRQQPPVYRHRARSTSPTSRTVSCPQASHDVSYPEPLPPPPASAIQYTSTNTSQYLSAQNASPTPRSGSKRSAQDAFSPTTASLSQLPSKRPLSMSLHIPEYGQNLSSSGSANSHSSSHSPLDGLQSFSKMSLNTSMGGQSPLEASSPWAEHGSGISRMVATTARNTIVPETLVTAYMLDEGKKSTAPQALYFYKLASSPLYDASASEESRPRKAVLRYHQPTSSTSSASSYTYGDMNAPPNGPLYNSEGNGHSTVNHITTAPQVHSYGGAAARFLQQPHVVMIPAVVQSASTSPAMAIGMEDVECGHLPHFHDDVWARPPAAPVARVSQQVSSQQQPGRECDSPVDTGYGYGYEYSTEQQQEDVPMYSTQQPDPQQMDYAPAHHMYSSSPVDGTSSGSSASSHSAAPAPYYHHQRQHQHHPSAPTSTVSVTVPEQREQHLRVPVPSATFANAGPPGVGVHFYPTPSQTSMYPPPLAHAYGYTYPHNPRQGGHASWLRMRNGVGC